MKQFELFDFLKGFSIFTILVFHYLGYLNLKYPFSDFIFFGGTGVHLFVLLSGFGLYLSYLKQSFPYVSYLKKRFSKIYVPYILIVLISALLSAFIPLYLNSLYALGGHIFLYKMFDEDIIGSYGYPLWFISMIFQFYILFYIIVYVRKRMSDLLFILISLGVSVGWSILVVVVGKESERVWSSFFLQYLWEFALGMLIASKIHGGDNLMRFRVKSIYFLVIGIINCFLYAALAMKAGNTGKMFNDIPALIGYSSIALWIYSLDVSVVKDFFVFTGKMSFSVYLMHILTLNILLLFKNKLPVSIILICAFMTCYFLAFYYQKFIDWGFRAISKRRHITEKWLVGF